MKKIAIPTQNNQVDSHFGHCEQMAIFTIDEANNIVSEEVIATPVGCGCKSNLAEILQGNNVSVLLAGGIGMGAISMLNQAGIQVYTGFYGTVADAVNQFLQGNTGNNSTCSAHGNHEHGEGCSHN